MPDFAKIASLLGTTTSGAEGPLSVVAYRYIAMGKKRSLAKSTLIYPPRDYFFAKIDPLARQTTKKRLVFTLSGAQNSPRLIDHFRAFCTAWSVRSSLI